MRIRSVLAFVVVVLVCSTSTSWAQQGRGGGRQGGFQGGGLTTGSSPLRLLREEAVQNELKLNADQVASVEELQEELRGQRGQGGQAGPGGQRGQRGQAGDRPQLTDEQRARFRERAAERAAQEKEKLAAILSDVQMARLNEIYIQQQGIQALLDADVAKQLGISDAQMATIEEAVQEARSDMRSQMQELAQSGDRQQLRAKMQELREQADQKVLALLTAEQKEQLAKMKGAEFEMPRGVRGGGQRGQGRANRGNQ